MFALTSVFTLSKAICGANGARQARTSSSLTYCLNLVRQMDYENYLCTLLLPDSIKTSAFALRAFNIEIARIQEQATEKSTLAMRYQFWEDCLNRIYENKGVEHPVVIELLKAVKRHKLSKLFLKRLITARANQLDNSTFRDMDQMIKYADFTTTPIYLLLLEASGTKDINCDHVAFHVGVAQGLTNLVRALDHNIAERLLLVPTTILMQHNVAEESIYQRRVDQTTLAKIAADINSVATSHLNTARAMKRKVPDDCRSIFLPAVAVNAYLKMFYEVSFSAASPALRKATLPMRLLWNKTMKDF